MRTRMKIMGLAALPLAGLLATGGAAMAQTAGTPAGTQVVQQAAAHQAGDPCPDHPATTQQDRLQLRDRDCEASGGHKAPQPVRTVTRTVAHAHHGEACDPR